VTRATFFDKIIKKLIKKSCEDYFSWTSNENSDVESFCPQDGHLPLEGFKTSFNDFNIFIVTIFSPHLPHVISTDIK